MARTTLDLESIKIARLIVHQFDAARPSPGGIDTCIRGLCKYAPADQRVAVVGVDTGEGPPERELGRWETYTFGGREILFMPVVRLDPGDQRRKIPHSLRLIAGLLRFRKRMPHVVANQAHRMDVGLCLLLFFKAPLIYFIHTQKSGLTGKTSDSLWRYSAWLHEALESFVARRAVDVRVFNPEYARQVLNWNPRALFSPTWFDPGFLEPATVRRAQICWVGRLEVPKDPILAIHAFAEFLTQAENQGYELHMVGAGTQAPKVKALVESLPIQVRSRVKLRGRLSQSETSRVMGESRLFLMTSHPGYEGYPRVLVEALASGLPSVVTEGSDTGSLIEPGVNGFVTSRSASDMADKLSAALHLSTESSVQTVAHLSAPVVVEELFDKDSGTGCQI
ncbi:glycosyltransferase family 4 protein [Arthrobacter sp. G119Y2]|uniref:glycosyltransferase family 4 protein n=1 Tax=Arthrobacter sp. G119Y2 TaxID=3134965 RepID=UPI00404B9D08